MATNEPETRVRAEGERGDASRPTLGMLLPNLVDNYETEWLGAVDAARAHDANLICFVGSDLEDARGFRAQANAVYSLAGPDRLDGLIVWTTALQLFAGREKMEEFCRRFEPLPIVSVEQELPGCISVLMDDRTGMYEAVGHLIEAHGCRRIGFIHGPESHLGMRNRFEGYLAALADHGFAYDERLVTPPLRAWHPEDAAAQAAELLADRSLGIDAFAAANDDLALAVVAAADARGLRVPDEVAVVGYDDSVSVSHHYLAWLERVSGGVAGRAVLERAVDVGVTVPLTTVRGPFYDLSRRSVEILLARLRGEPVPEVVTIPAELVVRRSCGCFSEAVRQPLPSSIAPAADARTATPDSWDVIAAARAPIAQRLEAAFGGSAATVSPGWADRLVGAVLEELRGESPEATLQTLDELIRETLEADGHLDALRRALLVLRRQLLPLLSADLAARAEDLWASIEVFVAEAAERAYSHRQLATLTRDQIVRAVGQRLMTTPDLAQLSDALAQELPTVGIPSCFVALYDSAPAGDPLDVESVEARPLLVYEQGRRAQVAPNTLPARSHVAAALPPAGTPQSLVASPLYFKDEQLGFALFEVGPRMGWIYEALQEQLSIALHGALLVERERETAEVLHREIGERRDAQAALQRARDELERRVAARTAELAQANEFLTEQILERQRAEETRSRLEAELRQAQKMEAVGRLAGGIAHDFNNILVVINGYTDLLLRQLATDDALRDDLEQIRLAGERASDLTQRLLAFARQQVLQPRVLNLNDVLTNLEPMLERLIGEDVKMTTRLAPGLKPVSADAGQIEQIVLNLVLNARDAMPDGGRLSIETDNAETGVLLRVTDTGVGMDAATRARLFEPFFTTKPPGRGTGLGLATVFGIVQQSGGHIDVSSKLGEGTTFEVSLPQAEATEAEAVETPPAGHSLEGSETILLVEDDAGVRGATRRFLEEHGYHVLEADHGAKALRVVEQHDGPVDLLITDVVMPEMSGPELAARVGDIRPEAAVLYVSGYTDSSLIREGLSTATIALLQKPFTADALARKVRDALDLGYGRDGRR